MQTPRRNFLKLAAGTALAVEAGTGILTGRQATAAETTPQKYKVLAFSGSRRLGKTTAAGLNLVLDSLREADANLETELIELANYELHGYGLKGADLPADDFDLIAAKIREENVVGLVFGTPSYFGTISSLMKIFLERFMAFRREAELKNKIVGAIAVGGSRNGGQERCLEQIWTALSCQQVIFAQDAMPTAHWGGTLWNQNDSIAGDEFGQNTAKNLGVRIAELIQVCYR